MSEDMQTVRDVLATEVMGWERIPWAEAPYGQSHAWSDDGFIRAKKSSWHPDTDWEQCGMVIKAMRAKGTDERPVSWSMHQEPMGAWAVQIWRFDDAGHEYMIASARCDTFPEAVALAAYRAVVGEESET